MIYCLASRVRFSLTRGPALLLTLRVAWKLQFKKNCSSCYVFFCSARSSPGFAAFWRSSTSVPQFALSKFLPFGSVSNRVSPIRIARRQGLVERLILAIHSPIADRFLCKASGAGTTASGNTPCATSGSCSAPCASAPSPRCLTWRMELIILMSKRTRREAGSQNDRLPGIMAPNGAATQPAPPDSMSELSHPSMAACLPRSSRETDFASAKRPFVRNAAPLLSTIRGRRAVRRPPPDLRADSHRRRRQADRRISVKDALL